MNTKLKRFLSLMLVFVMVFTMMPANAITAAADTSSAATEGTPVETPAAKIGDTPYATLEDAFKAAVDGDTIVLLRDVDEVVRLSVSDADSVPYILLDLNGKTWDCGYGTRINAVDLKIRNGVIGTKRSEVESGDSIDVFYFGGHGTLPSTMNLTGVTFNAELRVNNMAPSDEELDLLFSTKRSIGKAPNATTVVIWDGQYDVVTVQKAAYLTIKGGYFSGIHAEEGAIVDDQRDTANGNTGTATEDGTTDEIVVVKTVHIKTLDEYDYIRTEKGVTITFVDNAPIDERNFMKFTAGASSTTFTVQRQTADGWEFVEPNSGTSTIEHIFTEPATVTFRCDWDNNGTYDRIVVLVKCPVAKVDDKYYASIDEAVAAWTDGTTLTILTDATVNLGAAVSTLADEVTLESSITAKDGESALVIESGNVILNVNADITLTGGKGGAGIYVAEGASVTIRGEGKLTAIGNGGVDTTDSGAAGIGGTYANGNSGAITIDGATVVAKGYGIHGAGIGSGSGKVVGEIKIINGANVTAYGGYYADGAGTLLQSSYGKSDPEGGAAIGGGGKTASTIANITITDSTVVAYGGSKAAGIGANFWSNCGTITISGNSNVTAQGGSSSAGIGTSRAGDTGVTANIVISGGTVTATGGAYGAGIGGGYNADSLGNGADAAALPEISVTISGGTVTATGGEGGAGVGGGYKTDNIDIDITGGTVTAQAGALVSGKTIETGGEASAIGAGANGSGVFENCPAVEIAEAATVTAYTLDGGKPAIEGDTDENWDALDNVTIIKPWYDPDATEYIIMNADEMLEFAETVATGVNFEGKVVKLGDNIDLSGIDWAPIGGDSVYFAGEFDGQDYAIKNLTQTTGARMGLFGLVEKAYLHDFTMQNVNFTVNDNSARVGAIAGNLQYWNVVENVTIDGINIVVNGNDGLIGAAAGYVWKSQLGNVDVNNAVITVNGTGNVVAGHTAYGRAHVWDTGVTGNNAHWLDGTVQTINGTEYVLQNYFEGCDVSGIKMTLNGTGTEAGGFFGSDTYNSHSNYFVNCGVSGLDVTAAAGTSQLVGGFIAWNNGTTSAGTVKGFNGCSVSGTIKGANGTYGGFVGQVGGRACEYNNATANVNITSSGTAGGFVGITQAYSTHKYTFNNCTAKGSVSGVVAGGFTGKNGLSGDGKSVFVTYNFCSASGAVSATTTAGGFIGQVNTELPATNWNIVDSTGSLVLKGNTASTVVNGDGTVGYLIGYLDGVANGDAKEGNTVVVELTGNTPDGSDIGTGTGHHINISGDTILSDIVLHDSVAKVADEYYATLDEAFEAAVDGNEVEILVAGTYALNTSGKDITITGAVDGVVFDNIGAKNMGSANVTFNNVTFDYYHNVNYTGLQHSGNLVYNDCTFEGQVFLYGTSETFNNCTFNQNSADAYNVWTYGAGNVEFKGCTFNSVGKSVLLYSESNTAQTNLNVVDCDFIATAPVEGKAAIEIDTSLMKNTVSKVTIDAATTATGFDAGTVSGVSLWNDKRNQTNIEVWVDGVQVWPIFVASITDAEGNETKYNSLAAAVEAAEAGAIITVIGDHEITEPVVIEKDVTIDLNGKTVTGKEVYPMIRVQGGATVTVKNGTMTNDDYVFVLGASDGSSAGNLTIESGFYTGETTVASVTKGTLTVAGGEFKVTDAGYGTTYLLNCIDANYKDGSAAIVVTGGTFYSFNPEANAAEGADTNFVAEGYEAVESSENVWTVQVHYVAQVGETKYTSLAEAVAAANAIEGGATVTLLDDVTLGEKLTISGNVTIKGEYTITRDDAYTGTLFAVSAGAALTLDGGLTIDGGNEYAFNSELYAADLADWENPTSKADSAKWFTPEAGAPVATGYMITTSGIVNLNNVSIKNHYSTNGSGIVSASKGANVTLEGAQITHNASTSGSGLVVNASAGVWSREEELITVTMNAGTVIDGNHVGGNHGVFKIYMGTYFTMNGGEVKNTTGWNSNGTVVGIYHAVFTMNGGTICTNSSVYGPNNGRNAAIYGHSNHLFTMNGGTICHNTGRSKAGIDSPYSETGYTGQTFITGGTVVDNTVLGTWTTPDVYGGATLTITGGTYTQDVNEWCAYGYEAVDNGDGTWTVQPKVMATLTFKVNGVENTFEYTVEEYDSLQHMIGTNDYADFEFGAEVSPLLAYVADGNVTDIVLTLNSDLDESLVLFDTYYQIPVSYSMTLNLNGGSLNSTEDAIVVESGVNLTINGEGEVKGGTSGVGSWTAVWANGGNVTINGGTYSVGGDSTADATHQNDVIYTKNGGTVTINGGYFVNDGTVWTLNKNDSTGGAITVYGGTFEKFDPMNNVSEGEGTNFVAEGYISETKDEGDTYTVRKANYVAQVGETKYETLAEALEAAKGETEIVVKLLADATLDVTAWQTLAIGGETTETITINGNGYTLTFNQLNSDWNNVATNNGAKLILNDMTITNSGHNNGPWNRYDINFACDVELNNVTSNKALAFKAGASLNNVTVNESGDNYAIWIQANGQNVSIDGLTVNSAGRGIKIDEQYTDAAVVNLTVKNATFDTVKKGAILVKSSVGANVTVENVDISGAAADTVNVVWNDEDAAAYYGKVNVTGGTKIQEGDFAATISQDGEVQAYYKTLDEAAKASVAGDTITLLKDQSAAAIDVTDVTIDLNGTTLTLTEGGTNFYGNSTVKNGTISITGCVADGDCIMGVGDYSNNATLNLDNVNITGDGYSSAFAILYVYGSSTLNINGGSIVVSNDSSDAGGVIKGHSAANGKINITGTTMTFTDAKIGILDGTVVMDGVNLTITGGANAINGSALTVKNSTLTIKDCDGRALTLNQGDVTIENSTLNLSGATEGEIRFKKALTLTVTGDTDIAPCDVWADVEGAKVVDKNNTTLTITGTETAPETLEVIDGELVLPPHADMTYSAYGFKAAGEGEKYRENFMIDLYDVYARESLSIKMYSGGTLVATSTLRETDRDDETVAIARPIKGSKTVNVVVAGRLAGSWDTEWIVAPSVDYIPDTVEVYADGILVDTYEDAFTAEDKTEYAALPGVAKVASVTAADGTVTYYGTLDGAIKAANAGETVTILKDGTYKMPSLTKNLTIKSAEGVAATIDEIGAANLGGASVTFENITFDYYPNVNYTGLQHSGALTYNNCTFNGQVFLYGASETFNGCTFNQNSANAYNVWIYGAQKAKFTECTFNCVGKAMLVYNEGACANDVTVTDSKFIASAPVEGKAAIEIGTNYMPDGTVVTINNTTATGFAAGSISGETLWNDKEDLTNLDVYVDGEHVWPLPPVASITDADGNETLYRRLQKAVDAAEAGETITVIADHSIKTAVTVNKTVTIDLNGKSVSSAGDVFEVVSGGNLTIKGDGAVKGGANNDGSWTAVWANGGHVTINGGTYSVGGDSTADATHQNDVIYTKNGGTVSITGGEFLNDGNVWTLNQNDSTGGAITVSGGTFHNWNPENNVSEGANTNFVAKGYIAETNEDETVFTVVPNMIFELHLTDANGEAHWLSPMRGNDLNSLIETGKVWYESLQGTYDFTLKILDDCEIDEAVLVNFPMTIDLGGNTITSTVDAFVVTADDVTIEGNGTVKAGTSGVGSWTAVWANGGHVTINNGTFSVGGDSSTTDTTHQNDVIYTKNNGTVTINGGEFLNDGTVWTLNENDSTGGAITVKGGKFYTWNPENNVSEGEGTNFVAEGYIARETSENVWVVGEGTWVAQVGETKYETFEAALEAAKADGIDEDIVLLQPVEITEDTTYDLSGETVTSAGDAFIVTGGGTLTLNGDGVVEAGTSGVGSWTAVWANGGDVVINGGTYSVGGDSNTTGNHQNDVIYTKAGGTVTINGGTFLNNGTVWTLNENDSNRGTISVTGGTFQGWNPEDNVSEGEGTNFCAEGYIAVDNGDGTWTVVEDGLFDIYAANVKVGDSLDMFFYVQKSDLDGEEYYAEIVRTYADGSADDVVQIPYSSWESYNDSLFRFGYDGIAAKEMTDEIYVTVYNSDGTEASNLWTDSVSLYATRILNNGATGELRTVLVDMLNYGAAAQEFFGYNASDLANAEIGEYQQYATPSVSYADYRVQGDNYAGSTVSTKNRLMLTLYFRNITTDMTANISYTDHYGNKETLTVDGSSFYKRGSLYGIDVTGLAVADGRQLVTCEVVDANGTVVASASDSVESYVARQASLDPVFELLMKFVQSAYNYFH